MHVLLLHDALAPDAAPDAVDVLAQAQAIESVLQSRGARRTTERRNDPDHVTVERFACSLDLAALDDTLRRTKPDLVVNLVESLGGTGRLIGAVPALVETRGIAMTGCPSEAIHATSGKLLAKRLLVAAGLPTPAWRTAADLAAGRALPDDAEGAIIKSVWEHASIGLDDEAVIAARHVGDAPTLAITLAARRERKALGDAFVEAFIPGREFNLSLLERGDEASPQVLSPAEIEFMHWPADRPRIVGYAAKWDATAAEYHDTPRRFSFPPRDAELLATLRSLAARCWEVFGLRGYARVDFRVDRRGRPWILEVNTNPCLSPDAGFAAALHESVIDFGTAVDRIVAAAMRATSR
ncbi:MAG: hypothetical protein U0575_04660 [Phycisphaerales bacterium]